MKLKWFAISVSAGLLASCATILEGTSQDLRLSLTPAAAQCDAYQRGKLVGRYDPRSQMLTMPKSRRDAEIHCTAPGYRDKMVRIVSEASAWGVVGALTLDFGVVDYATGALNKYPASLQIVMEPIYLAQPPAYSPAVTAHSARLTALRTRQESDLRPAVLLLDEGIGNTMVQKSQQ